MSLQTEAVSAAYHPSASTVGVGTLDGHVVVLNGETGAHMTTVRVCGAPINAMAYNKVNGNNKTTQFRLQLLTTGVYDDSLIIAVF